MQFARRSGDLFGSFIKAVKSIKGQEEEKPPMTSFILFGMDMTRICCSLLSSS